MRTDKLACRLLRGQAPVHLCGWRAWAAEAVRLGPRSVNTQRRQSSSSRKARRQSPGLLEVNHPSRLTLEATLAGPAAPRSRSSAVGPTKYAVAMSVCLSGAHGQPVTSCSSPLVSACSCVIIRRTYHHTIFLHTSSYNSPSIPYVIQRPVILENLHRQIIGFLTSMICTGS